MASRRRINPWEVAEAPDTSLLDAFLATDPEGHLIDSAAQAIAHARRVDLMTRLLVHPDLPTFGIEVALWQASEVGDEAMVALLLEAVASGALELEINDQSHPPLQAAASNGHVAVMRRLLEAGAEVNLQNPRVIYFRDPACPQDGFTALLATIRGNHLEALEVLLEVGAEVNQVTAFHRHPLEVALELGHEAVAARLRQAGAVVRPHDALSFDEAVERGVAARVLALVDAGGVSAEGLRSAALVGAARDSLELVAGLIERGALSKQLAFEALARFAVTPNDAAVEALRAMGVAIDPPDGRPGQTPLLSAVMREDRARALELMALGANPNLAVIFDGESALMRASRNGDEALARAMLERGANPHHKNNYGDTALVLARQGGHRAVAKLLEEAGAKIRTPTEIARVIKRKMKKLSATAWQPRDSRERQPDGQRFGGLPGLGDGFPWPDCPGCGLQQHFIVQLRLGDLPDKHPCAGRDGMVQLFHCQECDCDTLRRVPTEVALVDGASQHRDAPLLPLRSFSGWWKPGVDLPHHEPGDALFEALHATLEPDEAHALFSLNGQGDKLGGWPCWVQHNAWPSCPHCQQRMGLLLQLASRDHLAMSWGDNGAAWIFACATHPEALAFMWQCH